MKKLILALSSSLIVTFGLSAGTALSAVDCSKPTLNTKEAIQCGASNAAGIDPNVDAGTRIDTTIGKVVDLLSVIVGIIAVIMIIVAGFRYITSGGNQESVKSAKNTLIYAVIGLVIVALAQIIVAFVLDQAT